MIELKTRERKIIAVCGALLLVAVIHFFIFSPVLKKRAELDRSIRRAKAQITDLKLLQAEYKQILEESERIRQRVNSRGQGFELFSFLDQTAKSLNLMSNLTSMKPTRRSLDSSLAEDIVEVRLEGISLENLVAFLYEIERAGGGIAIANIRIQQESRLAGGLNVSLLVTAINPS